MNRARWLIVAVAAVLALFVIAACGDDDEDDVDDGETPPAAETPMAEAPCEGGPGVLRARGAAQVAASGAAQEAEPLRIGILQPSTGGLAQYGPTIANGAKLAVKCINNYGGVNGAPIEVFEADSQSLPEPAVAAAQQLVDVNNVVAIVGPAGSTPAQAVAESVAAPNNVLLVSPSATGAGITDIPDNDMAFRTTISDLAQGIVLADLVETELGLQSVCAMYVNNAYGQGLAEEFAASFAGTVTASVAHEEEGVTFLSELQQCVGSDPEALIAMSYTTGQADVYLQEAIENNLIENFVFVDGTKDAAVFEELGWENFDGMWGTAPGALPPEFGAAFDAIYIGEYGELYTIPFVKEGYDAVVAIALAAELADTNTDGLAIRDALREVANAPGTQYGPGEDDLAAALQAAANGEDIDLTGASGALEFDENGDVLFGAIEIWQVQGEEIVSVRTVTVDLATGELEVITVEEDGDETPADGGETPEEE